MKGAPIRFVVAVLGGWTCIRIAVLLPGATPLELAGDVLAPPASAAGRAAHRVALPPRGTPAVTTHFATLARSGTAPASNVLATEPARTRGRPSQSATSVPPPEHDMAPPILVPATLGPEPTRAAPRRWSASAWLVTRGGASGTLSGGQLGASQAGARALYRMDAAHRLSLAGRIAAPLRGRGAEAAIGIDWQPTAAAVHLVAEQRIGLDGARGGPTAVVIAGLDPLPIAAGFRIEAYAQGGAILRDQRVEAFGDGALRLARPIAAIGKARIDIGAGAWAAGQRGVSRADIGPTVGVTVPVAGRTARFAIDWRQRVAGRARPGSGPALSIGSDF